MSKDDEGKVGPEAHCSPRFRKQRWEGQKAKASLRDTELQAGLGISKRKRRYKVIGIAFKLSSQWQAGPGG